MTFHIFEEETVRNVWECAGLLPLFLDDLIKRNIIKTGTELSHDNKALRIICNSIC
jgi:hypothetical protein